MVFITDSHKTKKDKITYGDTIKYNGVTIWVTRVNGVSGLSLVDLIKLSGQCRSYLYNVFNRNIYRLRDEILTGDKHRFRYLSLTGCVKLLSYMYRPDDGLIEILKDAIMAINNNTETLNKDNDVGKKQAQTNTMPDISLGEKVEELNKKFDDLYKKTSSIVMDLAKQLDDMGERQSKFMNMVVNKIEALEKSKTTNKSPDNAFKALLKEVLIDALKGGLNND